MSDNSRTVTYLQQSEPEAQAHKHTEMEEPKVQQPETLGLEVEEIQTREGLPSDEELTTLRRVSGSLPWSAFLVAVVELCERFAYYGLNGPFQNYMQHPYNDPSGVPGAIGLGQSSATGLSNFFQFWCYVTPIFGAVIADQYLGKYNTIVVFAFTYTIGLVILVCTSLPVAIEHGASLGGLVTAMVIIGLGTGGIKSNISPLIAEQVTAKQPTVKTLKSGEKVIIDPSRTVERVYMIFYLCINIGSLSAIATTELELHIGFWAAYVLPAGMFVIGFVVVLLGKQVYVVRPPKGSVIPRAFKIMWIGLINKGNLDAAKRSYLEESGSRYEAKWDDHFVDEIRRALVACRVFIYFPIYWVCQQQMLNNFISQAATMELHGIPNDIMQNINPMSIIIFIPICDRIVFPLLRKFGIAFKPITRITAGFFFASFAMAYAAIVQHLIYSSPPCYDNPMSCSASMGGKTPNKVHVAVQSPAYLLIGLSEILASITGLEYAFTKAPPSMKSFVMSLFLLTNAFGAALGIAISPTAKNPKVIWMFTGLSVVAAIAGVIFWFLYSRYNATEAELNALQAEEGDTDKAVPAHNISFSGRTKPDTEEKA